MDSPTNLRYKNFQTKYKSLFNEYKLKMSLENFIKIDDFVNSTDLGCVCVSSARKK